MNTFPWPERVTIREVGLRDGLQSIARTLPTAQKLQWLEGAYEAGIREIEVGSFMPPKLLPQLADTVGYADPRQVSELFARAREVVGDKLAIGHYLAFFLPARASRTASISVGSWLCAPRWPACR